MDFTAENLYTSERYIQGNIDEKRVQKVHFSIKINESLFLKVQNMWFLFKNLRSSSLELGVKTSS